jgi:hypothetical protein
MNCLRFVLVAAAAAFMAGPPAAGAETPAGPAPVWPAAPDKARVEFVKTFANADDLGIGKSFFARLKDFIFGEAGTRIVRPMAVVAGQGVIYVADPGARGVHRFDTTANDYALITAPDGAPLPSPVGLARGTGGEVFVTDSKLAQVFVIAPGTKEAQPLHLDAPLKQPTGIAFDAAAGKLYVVDTSAHRIDVFARSGALLGRIGTRGSDDGEFNFPTFICLTPQGDLYVTDSLNFRVQSFDAQGRFLAKFGRQGDGTGDAARQKGVAVDSYGHIYIVDALFHAFQIFDAAGRLLLPVGTRGQERGEFWLPTGIFIDRDDGDTIYIADSYNQRIQVLRYVGGAS